MKSIFRKIAFVLALAMVVTLFPVMSASAAVKDNKYARKKDATLYVGGDVDGDYQSCWAAQTETKTWMKEEGYKSSYKTSNEDVVTVSKYGFVEAVGVGTAEITATFSKKGEKDIVESFSVTVKKIASSIALDKESQEALAAGLNVDDTITLKATMLDADGSSENISDTIKFYCSSKEDKEIIQLDSNTGELKALKEGKATILVRSYQWEYDRTAKKKVSKVTAEKPYEVEVTKNSIDVLQTAWNKFSITFPDTASAEAAVKATLPSLSQENASVSEDKNVVKVYEVLKVGSNTATDIEQEIFIKNISNNENVVTVELFNELKEETTYNVKYQDYDIAKFITCKNVAESFTVDGNKVGARTEYSVEKQLGYTLFARGVNGQLVDITLCEAYGKGSWMNSVLVEDTATTFSPDYVFSGTQGAYSVWFYTTNSAFAVKLKASFDDWYVIDKEVKKLEYSPIIVTPGDTTITANELEAWGIVPVGKGNNYDNKQLAVNDSDYRLAVKASIKEYGQYKTVENGSTNLSDLEADKFTFKSSNDDKLSVDEKTGVIYPPKAAVDHVLVHVFYDGTFIGSCDVRVIGKRVFTSMNSDTSTAKLVNARGFTDSKEVKVFTRDQFNTLYNGNGEGYMQLTVALADPQCAGWLKVGTDILTSTGNVPDSVLVTPGTDGETKLNFTATASAPPTARTVRIVVTGTYRSNDQKVTIEKKTYFNITVKNTYNSQDYKSYSLEASTNTMDEILKKPWTNNTNISDKKVTISAYALDREGFKIEKLNLTNISNISSGGSLGAGQYAVLIKQGNNVPEADTHNVSLKGVTTDNGNIVFNTVAVSGAAVSGGAIEKMSVGSYSVNLFRGNDNGQAAYVIGTVISVIDTQDVPTFRWKANETDVFVSNKTNPTLTDRCNIANAALNLFFDNDRNGGIDYNSEFAPIHDADVVITGDRAYIKTVTYRWVVEDGNYYDFVVGINRTVKIQ